MNSSFAYGMWITVVLNTGLFLWFLLSFLAPRGRAEWRSMGLVTAFLVALFSEMYGFPLTIYLITGWLGATYPVLEPFTHQYGHLWVVLLGGSSWAWVLVMVLSMMLQFAGYLLLSKGWQLVHHSRGSLVTGGVYTFARHPQYTGLLLLIVGFLVQWPTLLTVLMAPLLAYAYVHLAHLEERAMQVRFGEVYDLYVRNTPKFFPSRGRWLSFMRAQPARSIDAFGLPNSQNEQEPRWKSS